MPSKSVAHQLHYVDRGASVPIVLLHGFPLDARIWQDVAVCLSKQFRVITPDLPGFGKSAAAAGPFTMESVADDLHQLLASLGALPCVLGGLSMGGYVCLAHLAKYPQDLIGLILSNTKHLADTPEQKAGRDAMIASIDTGGAPSVSDQMLPKMLGPKTPEQNPAVLKDLREMMLACPAKTSQHALRAMRNRPDSTQLLRQTKVPTLIIAGEFDAIDPVSISQTMHALCSGSQLAIIPESGHLCPIEKPGVVCERITEFVTGHVPKKSK